MTPTLLAYLADPVTKGPLTLRDARYDARGNILSGELMTADGRVYPIVAGIPRFVQDSRTDTVASFGDEWNYFNFIDFRAQWEAHAIKNTFGSTDVFMDRIVVDAGGGSGAQARWMLESGARHVIMLELSHSVDDVVRRNLGDTFDNCDVVQCSIDQPPLRDQSIDGIVICHNVIQHTPSVEATARALFRLVGTGGEFVFNCYTLNDDTPLRWVRFHLVYRPIRAVLSRLPFSVILGYARAAGGLSLIPGIGYVLEKAGFFVVGEVVRDRRGLALLKRRYRAAVLNTFDGFGSHKYQHHKANDEIRRLVLELQPDVSKIGNMDQYFSRPMPIGCALRVAR